LQRTYYIATMGCQMNEYDSEYVGRCLRQARYFPVEDPGKADLILINTCAVRAKAEQKAFSLLGRMISLKRRRPGVILGIMGCVAQNRGSSLLEKHPELDLVLGPGEIGRFGEILGRLEMGKSRVKATTMRKSTLAPVFYKDFFKGRVKGFITVMEGCNNFCTYCIVPYVRGREVSRPPEDILKEAEYLVAEGIKEITLLGQNVNSYMYKHDQSIRFSDLLRMLNETEGLQRIRFTTSHPKDLSDDLVQCFVDCLKLCSHIHLPFQAGSNRVLKAMNRGYTRETYMDLIRKLRRVRSEMALTSDVMVGFPGETREDFEATLDLIAKVEFDGLYSFNYSDREGTRAADFKDKIPEQEKLDRLSELQQLQRSITLSKNRAMIGKETEILVEGPSKKGGQLRGRTSTNKIVNLSGDSRKIGKLIKVVIKRAHANSLGGEEAR
jgi:tRNA-2-methylthio-N6-dimethylallyladenosine synthase